MGVISLYARCDCGCRYSPASAHMHSGAADMSCMLTPPAYSCFARPCALACLSQASDGELWWEAIVEVPPTAAAMSFCVNSGDCWDNNGGVDHKVGGGVCDGSVGILDALNAAELLCKQACSLSLLLVVAACGHYPFERALLRSLTLAFLLPPFSTHPPPQVLVSPPAKYDSADDPVATWAEDMLPGEAVGWGEAAMHICESSPHHGCILWHCLILVGSIGVDRVKVYTHMCVQATAPTYVLCQVALQLFDPPTLCLTAATEVPTALAPSSVRTA